MNKKYLSLALCIIILNLIGLIFSFFMRMQAVSPMVPIPIRSTNGEGVLAYDCKIPFQEMGMYELELIPGVADKLAAKLLGLREEILLEARNFSYRNEYEAFRMVSGVGESMAKKLGKAVMLQEQPHSNENNEGDSYCAAITAAAF